MLQSSTLATTPEIPPNNIGWLVGCFMAYQPFFGHLMLNQIIFIKLFYFFYGISTIEGYLMPNPFL